MKYSKEDIKAAREELLKIIKAGDTIYTVLDSVSRSGMSRYIKPFVMLENDPVWIGYLVAVLLGERMNKNGGVYRGGCGMDMGFSLVYDLSSVLFPDGFECIGKEGRCPSNDHHNGDRDYSPHHHRSGGYALRQKWM